MFPAVFLLSDTFPNFRVNMSKMLSAELVTINNLFFKKTLYIDYIEQREYNEQCRKYKMVKRRLSLGVLACLSI